MGVSSSLSGMNRRLWLSGSLKRKVWLSNCGQSAASAACERQSTSTRECSSPSSIFAGMPEPDTPSHSPVTFPGQTRTPSDFSRFAMSRTTSLSFALWLRKASYLNWIFLSDIPLFPRNRRKYDFGVWLPFTPRF